MQFDQALFHGLIMETPVRVKSATFRVTTERRWRNAVAAIKASTAGKVDAACALSRPHSSATAASTGRTLSSNQAGSSNSSQVPILSRRRPAGNFSTPLRISPRLKALRKRPRKGGVEPLNDLLFGFRPDEFRQGAGIDELTHRSISRPGDRSRSKSSSIPTSGELPIKATSDGFGSRKRSYSAVESTTAAARPRMVICCGPERSASRNKSLNRAFASWTCQLRTTPSRPF